MKGIFTLVKKAFAQPPDYPERWVQEHAEDYPAQFSDLEAIFARILNLAVSAAGIAVFVMLVVGGFKYLMAQGDPKAVESARGTLTWAIVGLFILIGAWFILKLIEQFTGLDLSTFSVKFPK